MNKLFDKLCIVSVLRIAGLFLAVMYIIQAFTNASRGAGFDDMALIFTITIANGLFQPLVLLGLAEVIARKKCNGKGKRHDQNSCGE